VAPFARPDVELEVAPGDLIELRPKAAGFAPAPVAPPELLEPPAAAAVVEPAAPARAPAGQARKRRRMPVVIATSAAIEQAVGLFDGRPLENVVCEAILASRMRFDRRLGPDGQVVDLGGGVEALVRRDQRSALQTWRTWRVVRLVIPEGLGGRVRAGRPPSTTPPPLDVPSGGSAPARALVDILEDGGAPR
jgi:hypothetical protein